MKSWLLLVLAWGVMGLGSCVGRETGHFQQLVNEATSDMVSKRYGLPHKVEQRDDQRTVWTYFERGSATAGYAGTARSSFCRAYVLTFDREGILRDLQQQKC